MNELNCQFYEEYDRLDQLCNRIYQIEDGIAGYIGYMATVTANYAEDIPGWFDVLEQLYRFDNMRIAMAQTEEALNEPLCSEADLQWLLQFRQRLLDRQDPLAILNKLGYRHEDATSENLRDEIDCEGPEQRFTPSYDRYVNGPRMVLIIIAAVLLTCLVFLVAWNQLPL